MTDEEVECPHRIFLPGRFAEHILGSKGEFPFKSVECVKGNLVAGKLCNSSPSGTARRLQVVAAVFLNGRFKIPYHRSRGRSRLSGSV